MATALPAHAATRSITITDGTGPAAVDTKTKLVYVGTTPSPPPGQEWNSSAGVAKIDPSKKKIVGSVILSTIQSFAIGEFVADVKISPSSKDLWVLVGEIDSGGGCTSKLYQLRKTTLSTVGTYDLGCARKIDLDPRSRWAYLTEAPYYDDRGENAQPITIGTVVAINGATGAVNRMNLPSPRSGITSFQEQFLPTSIAFDRKNYGIYVVGQGTVWIYTTKLKLVHTTKVDYPVEATVLAAANLTTNLIYFCGGQTLTEIYGPSGSVRRNIGRLRQFDDGDRHEVERPLSGHHDGQALDPAGNRKAAASSGAVGRSEDARPLLGGVLHAVHHEVGCRCRASPPVLTDPVPWFSAPHFSPDRRVASK